ncbi:hypothetical protein MMC18_009007, partial [Xylographa bjoerkii]|nr:hypothetical protein [Xylographa bjoerkii]
DLSKRHSKSRQRTRNTRFSRQRISVTGKARRRTTFVFGYGALVRATARNRLEKKTGVGRMIRPLQLARRSRLFYRFLRTFASICSLGVELWLSCWDLRSGRTGGIVGRRRRRRWRMRKLSRKRFETLISRWRN